MLRATCLLAENAALAFSEWTTQLAEQGIDIKVAPDVAYGEVDLLFACGLLTMVMIERGDPFAVVAAPIFPGEDTAVYRSHIVARADSPHVDLATCAGARLAVNEYDSWSGWHGYTAHLRSLGLNVSDHRIISGGHVASIDHLLTGKADIAAIDSSVWDHRRAIDDRLETLVILGTTTDWPAPPISVRTSLDPNVRTELEAALLALPPLVLAVSGDYAFMLSELGSE